MEIERTKTTMYLDPRVLEAARALAAATGRRDYEVFENAFRACAEAGATGSAWTELTTLLDRIGEKANLSEEESLRLAYSELHAVRASRRSG